jgi:hypothetical protein
VAATSRSVQCVLWHFPGDHEGNSAPMTASRTCGGVPLAASRHAVAAPAAASRTRYGHSSRQPLRDALWCPAAASRSGGG